MCAKLQRLSRCPWLDVSRPDYVAYHDEEWGVPLRDDRRLFEHLTLESAQAGLSWYTILRKREAYRAAFAEFDPERLARFGEGEIEACMQNAGIIRNRAKILAAIKNARCFLDIQSSHGSFAQYVWGFVDGRPIMNRPKTLADYQATCPESDAFSKDLRKRGFSFLGPATCYAYFQAVGLVNDHACHCFRLKEIVAGYKA